MFFGSKDFQGSPITDLLCVNNLFLDRFQSVIFIQSIIIGCNRNSVMRFKNISVIRLILRGTCRRRSIFINALPLVFLIFGPDLVFLQVSYFGPLRVENVEQDPLCRDQLPKLLSILNVAVFCFDVGNF